MFDLTVVTSKQQAWLVELVGMVAVLEWEYPAGTAARFVTIARCVLELAASATVVKAVK